MDRSYAATSAIGYQTTLLATPDASGNTHYEYIKAAAAAAAMAAPTPAEDTAETTGSEEVGA